MCGGSLGGCGSSSCTGICGGTTGALPVQLQPDITGFLPVPSGGGLLQSTGPNTMPYFSPSVPFAFYLQNLTLTPVSGVPLLIHTPHGQFEAIDMDKNISERLRMYISNVGGFSSFGVTDTGDGEILTSNGLNISTGLGTTFRTTAGNPININASTSGRVINCINSTSGNSDIYIENTNGNLTNSVDTAGNSTIIASENLHISAQTGNTAITAGNNTTPLEVNGQGNAIGLLVQNGATSNYGVYANNNSLIDNSIATANTVGATYMTALASGDSAISSTAGKLILNAITNVQIPSLTTGNVVSDASGNLSTSSAATFQYHYAVGPVSASFGTVSDGVKYHKVTIVGGGGGGGNKTGLTSTGASGSGGGYMILFLQGNTQYDYTVGGGGIGGAVAGISAGSGGDSTTISATGFTGSAAVQGGGGGGATIATAAGVPGLGGRSIFTPGTWGTKIISAVPNLGDPYPSPTFPTGGGGEFGSTVAAEGKNGGGSFVCPPGGAQANGGNGVDSHGPDGSGRGGTGGGGNYAGGGNGGSGIIIIESYL